MQYIASLQAAVVALQQQARSGGGGNTSGSSNSGNAFFCSPTALIVAASGPPGSGAPGGPLAAQAMFMISGGSYVAGPPSVDLYNAMGDDVVDTLTCACVQNPDGSFSVYSQSCD